MMNKIKYILSGLFLICLISGKTAHAAVNVNALLSTSGIVDLALLLCIIICLFWSMKIMSLVRGGLMSKSWQMFTLGFLFLILARLTIISSTVSLFVFPEFVSTVLYLLMTLTWLIGIFQTKRILA